MISRRHFLKRSSLVAFAPMIPSFLPHMASAATPQNDARVLVVIQLDGGNDGLNTVIPFADDAYAKARPTIRVAGDDLLKINDSLALNRSLRGAHDLLNDGRLAIVQN